MKSYLKNTRQEKRSKCTINHTTNYQHTVIGIKFVQEKRCKKRRGKT